MRLGVDVAGFKVFPQSFHGLKNDKSMQTDRTEQIEGQHDNWID